MAKAQLSHTAAATHGFSLFLGRNIGSGDTLRKVGLTEINEFLIDAGLFKTQHQLTLSDNRGVWEGAVEKNKVIFIESDLPEAYEHLKRVGIAYGKKYYQDSILITQEGEGKQENAQVSLTLKKKTTEKDFIKFYLEASQTVALQFASITYTKENFILSVGGEVATVSDTIKKFKSLSKLYSKAYGRTRGQVSIVPLALFEFTETK